MKFKLFAMILALSLAGWAQENSATPNASQVPGKSCCHHAMGAKEMKGCCHHGEANGTASCCEGNKCSMKDSAAAKSCCTKNDMKMCAKQCKKDAGCGGNCCEHAGAKSA